MPRSCFVLASLLLHALVVMFFARCLGEYNDMDDANHMCYCNVNCPEQGQNSSLTHTTISTFLEKAVTKIGSETRNQTQQMLFDLQNQIQPMISELNNQTQHMVSELTKQTQQILSELSKQQQQMSELDSKISALNTTVYLRTRRRPKDCAEIQQEGHNQSGVYEVFVGPSLLPVQVFCDLDHQGGGWLVFQRRKDGSQNFQQNWDAYVRGFGDLLGEFWLGNYFFHLVTHQKEYKLRIDLEDFENSTRYAEYSLVTVGTPSEKYILRLGEYSGNAGDAMTNHGGQQFSTIDQDNDRYSSGSCSSNWGGGGGWWYNSCHHANLNGQYLGGENTARTKGVNWYEWRGYTYSLKTTVMKIRPVNY